MAPAFVEPQQEPASAHHSRDLPGGFPSDSTNSFTSELRDEVRPLHQRRGSASPQTFVTSLSDDGRRTPTSHAADTPGRRPRHLNLVRSTSASALQTPVRSPAAASFAPSSARSGTTANGDGWATPRSSWSPAPDDASTSASSADHVLAWSRSIEPIVEPQTSSLLLKGRSSRYSASDRDDWTVGSRSRGTTPTEADLQFGDALGALSRSRRRQQQHQQQQSGLSLSQRDDSVAGANTHSLSDFRGMDKLELFLKFSQTMAEHEALKKKSAMEREALFDALSETRSALYDTRRQRDQLLKKLSSHESSADQTERINGLLRSKTLWQERAQSAASELEKLRGLYEESQMKNKEASRQTTSLTAKVSDLSSQLEEVEAKLTAALEARAEPTSGLPTDEKTALVGDEASDRQDTMSMPMQSTPPKNRPQSSAKATQSTPSKTSALPQSGSYTRLPTPSRIASPRIRHQSNTGSLADYDRMQKHQQTTPLHATKLHIASPDVSLNNAAPTAASSRIAKPKGTGLPRYRTISNNSTRSTISTSALNSSLRSESPLSQSAFAVSPVPF